MTTLTNASDRAFACFPRGDRRDFTLAQFRIGLRRLINPETGVLFTEDEIARATQVGSRWWIEADGLDIVLMAKQSRAIYLAQQMRPERANDSFLYGYHGDLWGQTILPAKGGAGSVQAKASYGTVFVGSTTIPDPAAHTARDEATGLRFQVLETVTADATGIANPILIGIDTGEQTNLAVGAILRWEDPPLGAEPEASVVSADFRGGRSQETSAEYARRLRDTIRHKAASGNRAHFRAWAREDSSILDAYIYPCAMYAGSVLVCITQRRGKTVGPNALVASSALLTTSRAYLVPPGSTVVPERALVNVVTFTPEPSMCTLQLAMQRGSSAGWTDSVPWPGYLALEQHGRVIAVSDSTHFTVQARPPPYGPTKAQPSIMAWSAATSSWTKLYVQSWSYSGSSVYAITLAQAASLAAGDYVSPDNGMRDQIALSVQAYFDSLGPGEVVDIYGDVRSDRAARYPAQEEEAPASAGDGITEELHNAFSATSLSRIIPAFSVTTPSLPAIVVNGPNKLTLGALRVFAL